MQHILIERLDDTLRYNDLAENHGGWGLVFFVEEQRYLMGETKKGPQKIVRVWLTDHNVQNYLPGTRILIINMRGDIRTADRRQARIIAAVNPKMAKRMADVVKDALRAEGLRADTPIDVVDRRPTFMGNVNGREAA